MASNLRVDTILPSTGTTLGIGTASGTINFLGNSNIVTTGSVSIGGTLTYEDVTNVDSVGVITAREGMRVGAGKSIGSDGAAVVYYGDGSNLTGISAGVSLANGADNRVVTATGANALQGETGVVITPDSELIVGMTAGGGATPDARLQVRGDTFAKAQIQVLATQNDDNPASLQISKSRSSGNTILGDNDDIGQINFAGNDGNGFHNVGRIMVSSDGSGNGNDDLPTMMRFFTTANGGVSLTERMRISSEGYVTKPYNPCASMTIDSSTISGNYMSHSSVHTNIGNHYNTGTSIFTCPVAGLYYVSIMVMSNNNNQTMDLEFHINGSNSNNILVPYSAATGGSYNQAVGSTIVSCPLNAQLRFKLNSGSIYGGRHSNMTFALFA